MESGHTQRWIRNGARPTRAWQINLPQSQMLGTANLTEELGLKLRRVDSIERRLRRSMRMRG